MRFVHVLVGLFVAAALPAAAAVTVLPGSTPQSAPVNAQFPNPIRVRVTDGLGRPVAGAMVGYGIPAITLTHDDWSGCFNDLGWVCNRTADADGIATIPPLRAGIRGDHVLIRVFGRDPHQGTTADLGQTTLDFTVVPNGPTKTLGVVEGANFRCVANTPCSQLVFRAQNPSGTPVPGAQVSLRVLEGASVAVPSMQPADFMGLAVASPPTAGWGLGHGKLEARFFDSDANAWVWTTVDYTITNARGETLDSYQDMWWSGAQENGWGMSLVQHGQQIFGVIFAYDNAGKPTWWVLPGGDWFAGTGSMFNGLLYSPRSSPYFAYDASRFDVKPNVGSASLTFNGTSLGRMVADLGSAPNVTNNVKSIVRQDFSTNAPSPMTGLGDMWWGGPSQNGWGVAILEQPGNLFSVWFTYDADGLPTWFVMPGGTWRDASTYAGTMYRTTGSQWAGHAYDPSLLTVTPVGPYTLRFTDREHASLEWTVEGRRGTLALTRQPF